MATAATEDITSQFHLYLFDFRVISFMVVEKSRAGKGNKFQRSFLNILLRHYCAAFESVYFFRQNNLCCARPQLVLSQAKQAALCYTLVNSATRITMLAGNARLGIQQTFCSPSLRTKTTTWPPTCASYAWSVYPTQRYFVIAAPAKSFYSSLICTSAQPYISHGQNTKSFNATLRLQ